MSPTQQETSRLMSSSNPSVHRYSSVARRNRTMMASNASTLVSAHCPWCSRLPKCRRTRPWMTANRSFSPPGLNRKWRSATQWGSVSHPKVSSESRIGWIQLTIRSLVRYLGSRHLQRVDPLRQDTLRREGTTEKGPDCMGWPRQWHEQLQHFQRILHRTGALSRQR